MIKKASQQLMRETNAKTIFKLIQLNPSITRASLAKMTKLSPTTISTIVEKFINDGYVIESSLQQTNQVGRRAITLELNDERKYSINIRFDYEQLIGCLNNLKTEKITELKLPWSNEEPISEQLVPKIIQMIRELLQHKPKKEDEILGIGIAIPGMLDEQKHKIILSTPYQMTELSVFEPLQTAFPTIPIMLENETLLAAIGAKNLKAETSDSLLYISMNEGLGASMMTGKTFLQGGEHRFLEIGHMSLKIDGEKCFCGNYGCFEQYVSIGALWTEVENQLRSLSTPNLLHESERTTLQAIIEQKNLHELFTWLANHDRLSTAVNNSMGTILGRGIVNLIHIFNPSLILLGGKLAHLGEKLLTATKNQIYERTLSAFLNNCEVELIDPSVDVIGSGSSQYVLEFAISGT